MIGGLHMKKTVAVMLILCIIFSMTISSFADNGAVKAGDLLNMLSDIVNEVVKKLPDIANHWAKDFIATLTQKGIIGGYPDGTFKPNNKITVAEFTALILKSCGFTDLNEEGVWYRGIINTAGRYGLIQKGEFNDYNRAINRGEMARIVVRAMVENTSSGKTDFTDDAQIPSSVKGHVKRAVELGIISGYPDSTFKSSGNATRAEASTIITKMLEKMDPNRRLVIQTTEELIPLPKPDFIEPKIEVVHNTNPGTRQYFEVVINNIDDYTNEYQFKIESVNYPQLNVREQVSLVHAGYDRFDLTEWRTKENMSRSGRIFVLGMKYYTLVETEKTFKIEEGMKIKFKVTVKKGKQEKEYFEEVTVRKVG